MCSCELVWISICLLLACPGSLKCDTYTPASGCSASVAHISRASAGRLRSLVHPQVGVCNHLFEDRGATLIRTVQRLPALEYFEIHFYGDVEALTAPLSDSYGLPRCKELAELHSHSLSQMRVYMLGGPEIDNTLRLGGLPALRSCELVGELNAPLHMRVNAASFDGAPLLQRLSLQRDEKLQLQPESLGRLTALTSLTLTGCGLRAVPAELASLSTTLCELDLSHNARLVVDSAALATIMHCSRLGTLSLFKPNIGVWRYQLSEATWHQVQQHIDQELNGYTPTQYSEVDLPHLMRLPSEFHKRYGHDLTVCVTHQAHDQYLRARSQV